MRWAAGILVRASVVITGAILLALGLPGGASASGSDTLIHVNERSVHAYGASAHAYDSALHSVAAHTSEVAVVVPLGVSRGAQVTAAMMTKSFSLPSRLSVAANTGGVVLDDAAVIVRGGEGAVPPPGQVFSGAYGATEGEAGASLSYGQIRTTTAGEIRVGGGTVEVAPEMTRGGMMNDYHVDICLGTGSCPFGPLHPNPIPKGLRIQ
jgi:hypothetical protein